LADLPRGSVLLADKAYDSSAVRLAAQARGASANIPSQADRKHPPPFNPDLHRARNVVERAFCRLKDGRRIATRYDKLARNYLAAVHLIAVRASYLVESTP
jgi:transposase